MYDFNIYSVFKWARYSLFLVVYLGWFFTLNAIDVREVKPSKNEGLILLSNNISMSIVEDTSRLFEDTIRSQWNPVDSVRMALRTKPFITGALDGRNSFVSADPVSIFGLRYGYDWGKVAAHTGIYSSKYIEFTGNDSMLYRFRYISSTFEYKLYRTYRYSFLCFGQLGIGATSVKSKLNPVGSPDLKPMIPIELGMYGSVRLLRYFGLAAGLGTRLAMLKGGNRFSGPIYTFGITYFPSAMLEDGKKVMEKLNINLPTTSE